jgi:hypothetical protein
MKVMGKHSPPVDGEIVANGHALLPFAIPAAMQPRQGGPVSPWPHPAKADRWQAAIRRAARHRGWLAAIPVVLVNAVAFSGQLAFLRGHLPWPPAGQVLVAVTLESVAVYLAWQAHLALAADDSALRLRLAAYGFAAVIGVMNYSHWMAPHWRPTFAAVTFGLMSVSSPWLWSVHSRRASRDALKAKGLIEPHAVRLGGTRWTWHPWRCVRVMSRASWQGENDPAMAIALPPMKAAKPAAVAEPAAPDGDTGGGDISPPDGDKNDDTIPPPPPPGDPPKDRQKTTPAIAKATAAIRRWPKLTDAEVAKKAGVSERTVQRARPLAAAPGGRQA